MKYRNDSATALLNPIDRIECRIHYVELPPGNNCGIEFQAQKRRPVCRIEKKEQREFIRYMPERSCPEKMWGS